MEDLKVSELLKLAKVFNVTDEDNSHWEISKNYLIRTVTMIQCGKLEKVTDKELVISSASWIPDTGRFSEALKEGSFDEVEVFNSTHNVIIGRGAIIDAQQIDFDLPKKTK